jgi:hypothetical protein
VICILCFVYLLKRITKVTLGNTVIHIMRMMISIHCEMRRERERVCLMLAVCLEISRCQCDFGWWKTGWRHTFEINLIGLCASGPPGQFCRDANKKIDLLNWAAKCEPTTMIDIYFAPALHLNRPVCGLCGNRRRRRRRRRWKTRFRALFCNGIYIKRSEHVLSFLLWFVGRRSSATTTKSTK